MINVIVIVVILAILGGSVGYIIRAKKSGVKCIGCPAGGSCSGHCHGASQEASCACQCAAEDH